MKTSIAFGIALLTAGSLFAADTNDKVKDAISKLKAASNYSWTTTVKLPGSPFEPGPLKGRTELNGYAVVSQTFNDNALDAVFKGTNIAVKTDGEWKVADPSDPGSAMMAGMLTRSGTPADEADNLLKKVKTLTADSDMSSGDLTPEGAKELLTFGPRDGGAP